MTEIKAIIQLDPKRKAIIQLDPKRLTARSPKKFKITHAKNTICLPTRGERMMGGWCGDE